MKEVAIIKIGGSVIDDSQSLDQFLCDFAAIDGLKVLVHGGGKIATEIGLKMGTEAKMHEGRRITDQDTLDLVTMVYGGLLNKKIVASLQAKSCDSIGLTGADGNLLRAEKRPVAQVDYGFAGDIKTPDVNVSLIDTLLGNGLTLVIPALTHDGQGHMLNTNADTMASIIAQALSKHYSTSLIYCFEQLGVMEDLKSQKLFTTLSNKNTKRYIKENVIHSGMLPKLKNAFDAKSNGVAHVRIGHFNALTSLVQEEGGTEVQ